MGESRKGNSHEKGLKRIKKLSRIGGRAQLNADCPYHAMKTSLTLWGVKVGSLTKGDRVVASRATNYAQRNEDSFVRDSKKKGQEPQNPCGVGEVKSEKTQMDPDVAGVC